MVIAEYSPGRNWKSQQCIRKALRCSDDAFHERNRRVAAFCGTFWRTGAEACQGGPPRCMAGMVSANGMREGRVRDYLANGDVLVVLIDSGYNTSFWLGEMYH
jgi:hypothetical protein